jgi:tetratricopeptide (TPR) repeat protein
MLCALLALIVLAGCQSSAQTVTTNPVMEPSHNRTGAKAYHYFLAAQQKLKQGDVNEAIWLLNKARTYDPDSTYLKLETSNLLLIKKQPDEALGLIEQVLEQDPNNQKALIAAGRIYQQRNESEKAKAVLERAMAATPADQNVYLLLGRIYWDKGDVPNTVRVFERMVAAIPDSYTAYFFYGKALATAGELDRAEQALLKSLELEPSLTEPRLELLDIYKIQKRPEKITEIYQTMLSADPTDIEALLGLAEHYRHLGHPDRAKALLRRLGKLSLSQSGVITKVFDVYLEPKQYEAALWVIQGMLTAVPKHSDLHYMAGIAADGLEHHAEAVAHLGKVQSDSRFYSSAVMHSALIYHDMGKIDRAIAVMQSAIDHSPNQADFFLYLGSFYEELERYDEAIGTLRKGLQVDGKNARLHFRLGVIYDKVGQKQASIDTMKMVIKLTPDDAEALNYLGYTYADLGINLDEAETLIQTALKLKPDDGYITDSLAWVYFKRGHYREALQLLQKAIQLVPDDPVILEHLGDVYQKLNSKEKAINCYRRSLDNNAKDSDMIKVKIRTLDRDNPN